MNKITKALALAGTAAAMAFGTMAAHASLLGDTIYGCGATSGFAAGGSDVNAAYTAQQNCVSGTDAFTGSATAASVTIGGGIDFTSVPTITAYTLTADFGANSFTISLKNNSTTKALSIPSGAGMIFYNLDFQDGTFLQGVGSGTLNGAALTDAQLKAFFNAGTNDGTIPGAQAEGGYLEVMLPAASIAAGGTAVLTGTFVTGVPEPGSLALLGVVLLVVGLIRIARVRRFSFRLMGRKLAA
jgi:hypothetical protein